MESKNFYFLLWWGFLFVLLVRIPFLISFKSYVQVLWTVPGSAFWTYTYLVSSARKFLEEPWLKIFDKVVMMLVRFFSFLGLWFLHLSIMELGSQNKSITIHLKAGVGFFSFCFSRDSNVNFLNCFQSCRIFWFIFIRLFYIYCQMACS